MKKFTKLAAVLAALVLALSCFVACSSGDDDDDGGDSRPVWVTDDGKGTLRWGDGTYTFTLNGDSYNGTYSGVSAAGIESGKIDGDVRGTYTIIDGTMTVTIGYPSAMAFELTKK